MKKFRIGMVLALVACMTLTMGMHVFASESSCEVNGHTPDESGLQDPNYTDCNGGYKEAYYVCTSCGLAIDADGNEAEYEPGTNVHTPGAEKYPACYNYYGVDYYKCTGCNLDVDEFGAALEPIEGPVKHNPGTELYTGEYIECYGGYEDHYLCEDCGTYVYADGTEAEWIDGDGEHSIVYQPENAATTEVEGNLAFWYCEACGIAFEDEDGTVEISDLDEYIIPKLSKEDASSDTEGSSTDVSTTSPKTGDEMYVPMMIMISALTISAAGIYVSASKHFRK